MSTEFGQLLKLRRMRQHLTQQELADRLGTSRNNINNYERGVAEPSFAMLCEMSKVLDCAVMDILPNTQRVGDGLTDEEKSLLNLFRGTDQSIRDMVIRVLLDHQVANKG